MDLGVKRMTWGKAFVEITGVSLGEFVEEATAQALRGVRLPPGGSGGRRRGWCAHAQPGGGGRRERPAPRH